MTDLPTPKGILPKVSQTQNTQETVSQQTPKKGFIHWLSGLVSNPATGLISHTKLWANIAGATMTYKFAATPNAPEWLWWAYGAMVGGYALVKRGIAAIPQLAEIKKGNHGQ